MRLLSFLLVSIILFCSAAQALDLSEMQKMALGNRKVIQQYVTVLEQSEKDVIRAKSTYYPSVDLSYTANALDESTTFENESNSVFEGRISYRLFSGFRDKYSIKSSEELRTVEDFRLRGIKQDVQLNVALAYLEVYERLANKRVAASAYETLEKVYRDGESRYQVGLIGKNELLTFRVDYDNADITLKAADAGLRKSVNNLSRQVGRYIRLEELDFKDFVNLPELIDREDYRSKMLTQRSEINVLESVIEANKVVAKAEHSEYYPKVDIAGIYQRYDDEYINGTGDDEQDELRAQLIVSMNLFRGFSTEATVARAKLETRAAQYELDELKEGLTTTLDNLYIDFEVSLENVEVALRSIEQAEENLRITQLKYDEGLQRESELLDAITNLSRAQYNHVSVIRTVFLNDFQLTRMIDGF